MNRLRFIAVSLLIACLSLAPLSAQSTVGISESFDNISSGIPADWTNSTGTTTTAGYKWTSYATGYSSRCVRFNSKNNPTGRTNLLTTPAVNLSSGAWQVRFMYKNPAGGNFTLLISTDGGSTYSVDIANGGLPNVTAWTEHTIVLTPFLSTGSSNVKIGFQGTSNFNGTDNGYIYLDEVEIERVPTCQSPINLMASNATPNSIDISWSLSSVGSTPSLIEINVKNSSGTVVYTKSDIPGTQSTFTVPSLQPSTTYTAVLRSDCSASSQGYSRTSSINFTTACAPLALPYTENYDALSSLSTCGYYHNATLDNGASATAGGKSVKLSTATLSTDNAYIIFPALNANNNAVECIMKVRGGSYDASYQAGIVTDPTNINDSFIPVTNGTIQAGSSWQDILFNTNSPYITPVANPVYVCFVIGSGVYNSVYVDNVDIHAIPTCVAPDNFRLVSNTYNSATLAWNSSASSFVVEISDGNTTTTQNATASPFTVTGLNPSTSYSFRVKAVCSASDESRYTLNNVSCHTYCSPIAGTVFVEGAESTSGTALPSCWLSGYYNDPQTGVTDPFISQGLVAHTGNRGFALAPMTGNNVAWVASQGFNVTTPYTHQVTIWVYRDNTENAMDGLRVYISNAPGDTTGNSFVGFIPLGYTHAPAEGAPGWNSYSFLINQAGVKYITLKGNNSSAGAPIYFDDVTVEPEPTCPAPRSVITGTPADVSCPISWTAGGQETQWRLIYTLSKNGSVVETNDVVVSQPNYTFTNLDPSSNYTYTTTIYAICSASDSSAARVDNGYFSTQCVLITEFPYTEDFESDFTTCHNLFNGCTFTYYCDAALSRSTSSKHGGNYSLKGPEDNSDNFPTLALPMMDFTDPNGYTVKFWMYRDNSNYSTGQWAKEGFRIFVSSNNTNFTDTTLIGFISSSIYVAPTEPQSGWYQYSFDIPPTISGHKHIFITYDCKYGRAGYIDDITVQVSTGCRNVYGTATPSYNSALIALDDTTATEWELAYQENTATATPTVVTVSDSSHYNITGLTDNTDYVFQVRRICPDTTSDWSSPQLFHTLLIPDTLPYISSFEDATDNAKWVLTTGGSSNFFIGSDANAVSDGSQALYVSYDNYTYGYNVNGNAQAYASRLFHFDGLEYNISFRWKCTGGEINADTTSIYDFGRVFLVPGSTEFTGGQQWYTYGSYTSGNLWPAGMIPLDPDNAAFMALATGDANGWNNMSKPVSMVGREGDYKIVFMWNNESGGAQYPLAIDQLNISAVSCRRPNLGIANLTSTSANVTVGGGNAYRIIVNTTPIDVFDTLLTGDILDTILTTGTSVPLTGLTSNTTYYYTAQNICDSVDRSEWLAPLQFVTPCLVSVPYTESFEVADVLDCWSASDPNLITVSGTHAHSGLKSLSADGTIAISPELDIDSMARYNLTGWLYSPTVQTVGVGVAVDPSDVSSIENVATYNLPANTWFEFSTGFTLLNDPEYSDFAGARHFTITAETGKTLFADELFFGLLPACSRPTSPVITDTVHNGFTMSWTDPNASEWIVVATPVAGGASVSATTSTQSIVFTGLTEQTQYAVSLAAICAAGDTSLYVSCGVITTPVYVPTCPDPVKAPVVESTTMTTMTVSADNSLGTYTVLEFAYGPATMVTSPDQASSSVFTTSGQAVISGLSANLDYNVWYRGVCEPGDTSRWSVMATGRTTYNNFFMPQNPHVVGYPESTTIIAWGIVPDADLYEYELTGDSTIVGTITSDTLTLNGLSYASYYNFRVRAISTTMPDTSAWSTLAFKTLSIPAEMPFVCDFESTTDNNAWDLINGSQANYFTINDINYTGFPATKALYITGNGSTPVYSNTPSTVYAARTVSMLSGIYNVQFDWMCAGEPGYNPDMAYDYPRFFLAPAMMDLTAGTIADGITYNDLPDGCIALEGGIHLTQALSLRTETLQVHVPLAGLYNLVVFWTNDNSTAHDPGIIIDNINVYPLGCVAPAASLVSTTQNSAAVAVTNYSQTTSAIVYSLSLGSRADAFLTDTIAQADTIRLSGLTVATNYNLFVASACAGDDETLWTLVQFRTDCGTVDVPYTQGFENLNYFYNPGLMNTICWSDLNAGANYSDYPNYRAATGGYITEGQRSLQLNGGTTRDLFVILPAMTDPANAQMAFDIAYENTSDCGIVSAGYMTDPADASTFTSVLTAPLSTSFSRLNAIYGNIPSTARLAFRYAASAVDGVSAYIDHIRVSKVVSGAVYNETICYAQSYNDHGFNVPASRLSVGLNTLTRVTPGQTGCPDTVITANVTMLAEFATNYYDTICPGTSYSGHGFNISNPATTVYTRPGTSVTGCDSTTYLYLYVIPGSEVLYDTICNGDSYNFHGQILTSAGTYNTTYTSPLGCQVQATLHLYVDAVSHTTYESICKGESFTWYGNVYTATGTYSYQGINPRGCTVNDTLQLYVINGDTAYTVQICSGKAYQFIDTIITTSGVYTRTFVDPYIGCTVTHTLTAIEVGAKTEDVYDYVCEGRLYTGYGINNLYVGNDTVVTVTTKSMDNCDSVASVHITLYYSDTTEINHVMNPGDNYTFDDRTLTTPGDYYAYRQNVHGCDSIVILHLALGTENVVDVRIDVVPNPVNVGATALVYGDFGEIRTVQILNSIGQMVDTFTPDSYPIEVNGISAAGLYYIRLITASGDVHIRKLIVQ